MNRPHFTIVGFEGGFGIPDSIARADGREEIKAIAAKHHFTCCMFVHLSLRKKNFWEE